MPPPGPPPRRRRRRRCCCCWWCLLRMFLKFKNRLSVIMTSPAQCECVCSSCRMAVGVDTTAAVPQFLAIARLCPPRRRCCCCVLLLLVLLSPYSAHVDCAVFSIFPGRFCVLPCFFCLLCSCCCCCCCGCSGSCCWCLLRTVLNIKTRPPVVLTSPSQCVYAPPAR